MLGTIGAQVALLVGVPLLLSHQPMFANQLVLNRGGLTVTVSRPQLRRGHVNWQHIPCLPSRFSVMAHTLDVEVTACVRRRWAARNSPTLYPK